MSTQSKSKKLFKDVDPAEARKVVLDYFNKTFLDDDAARGADEESARSAMFDKLAELESVVRDLRKGLRKK